MEKEEGGNSTSSQCIKLPYYILGVSLTTNGLSNVFVYLIENVGQILGLLLIVCIYFYVGRFTQNKKKYLLSLKIINNKTRMRLY